MKKLLVIFLALLSVFSFGISHAEPSFDNCGSGSSDMGITDMLNACQPKNVLESSNKGSTWGFWGGLLTISTSENGGYELKDFKGKLLFITTNLVILASILAIGGIVYAGIMFTTAYGDDAKIKKAKDAIKWSLVGFLVALASQQLINAIINLVYGIAD